MLALGPNCQQQAKQHRYLAARVSVHAPACLRSGAGHGLPDGRQRRARLGAVRTACRTARLATCTLLSQSRETIAVPVTPITRAAPVDRSMHRPFTNGPRSLIRTVTLRPFECEVTVT
jgi:hypothetical protein